MIANDNWGWRARIGMFIVASEAIPEAEWWAMMPPGVSVHAARIAAGAPWARRRDGQDGMEFCEDLDRGLEHFAAMQLSAVVIGHSSSSIAGGKGWDQGMVASLAQRLGPGVVATTNGIDCRAALEALAVRRPFLVLPPWFSDETVALALAYLKDHGCAAVGHLRHDPGRKWRDLAPGALYSHGMGFAQQVEPLYSQIRAACPSEADGVLIAGTGLRCVAIIEALEQDLGRPVVTANQASLWHCLRRVGVMQKVEGYGSLLRR